MREWWVDHRSFLWTLSLTVGFCMINQGSSGIQHSGISSPLSHQTGSHPRRYNYSWYEHPFVCPHGCTNVRLWCTVKNHHIALRLIPAVVRPWTSKSLPTAIHPTETSKLHNEDRKKTLFSPTSDAVTKNSTSFPTSKGAHPGSGCKVSKGAHPRGDWPKSKGVDIASKGAYSILADVSMWGWLPNWTCWPTYEFA